MAKQNSVQQSDIIRAVVYLRVSTDEQAAEGYGLDVQRTRAKAQIEAKGWHFAGEYSDAGLSGTLDASKRPALAQLLQDAHDKKIDAVVVLALDRLARKTLLVLSLVEMLEQADVALVSCKESLDTSTPQGRFVLTMFAALAELERGVIEERTTAGRNERGRVDGERGGRLPDGYQRLPEGIAIVEARAEIVRLIFALRAQGKSLRDIAKNLNDDRYLTARGKSWHASSVREIILNERDYRGGTRGESDVRWIAILAA